MNGSGLHQNTGERSFCGAIESPYMQVKAETVSACNCSPLQIVLKVLRSWASKVDYVVHALSKVSMTENPLEDPHATGKT